MSKQNSPSEAKSVTIRRPSVTGLKGASSLGSSETATYRQTSIFPSVLTGGASAQQRRRGESASGDSPTSASADADTKER